MNRRVSRRWQSAASAAIMTGVLMWSSPAGAHGTNAPPASNIRTTVSSIIPSAVGVTAGVAAGIAANGDAIEIRATGRATVIVFGYRGEPYLRVDRRGAFENRSSPAVAQNRNRDLPDTVGRARPVPPPRWVQVSDDPVARWHDHRAHWMGGTDRRAIGDRGREHVIERWAIPIRVDDAPAVIRGTLLWQPPPSPWPWIALAGLLAAFVVIGSNLPTRSPTRLPSDPTTPATRRTLGVPVAPAGGRFVIMVAVAVMAMGETLHLGSGWAASDAPTLGWIGENGPGLATIVVSLVTLVSLTRRDVWSMAPLILLAGLFGFVSGGLADVSTLSHSVIPTRLRPGLSRGLVSIALGVGLGLMVVAGHRFRRRSPAPASAPAPDGLAELAG